MSTPEVIALLPSMPTNLGSDPGRVQSVGQVPVPQAIWVLLGATFLAKHWAPPTAQVAVAGSYNQTALGGTPVNATPGTTCFANAVALTVLVVTGVPREPIR